MRQSEFPWHLERLKHSLLGLCLMFTLTWSACKQSVSEAKPVVVLQDSTKADTVQQALDSLAVDTLLPPMKSQAARRQLQTYWEDALALERALLGNENLNRSILELKDFVGDDGIPIRGELKDAEFAKLSVRELLAYQIMHPESWAEVEGNQQTRAGQILGISRKLPQDAEGFEPSERQMSALRKDTSALKNIVLECLEQDHAASIPLLRIISEFKIREAILPLVSIYQAQTVKDDLILTTLTLLMEKSMYWKWLKSDPFKSMLLDVTGTAALTEENAAQILEFARQFSEMVR